ncbi:hypothetical protein BC777_0161 [Yoonia maricola]|uniref:Uncharacterized protein n=1 Tax=Yoonia maricola TaxID=420999 RepID=A0A2M8WK72_9RHOB|nr:hypothetical protein [Yoonia maricola]PJI91335.1 hypothetical protein BC777_0161 [Yoonia maricola]
MAEVLFIVVPFGLVGAVFFAMCFAFGKRRMSGWLTGVAVLLVIFAVLMIVGIQYEQSLPNNGRMQQERALDGLGYVLALIGFGVPAIVGGLLGGGLGWFQYEEAKNA